MARKVKDTFDRELAKDLGYSLFLSTKKRGGAYKHVGLCSLLAWGKDGDIVLRDMTAPCIGSLGKEWTDPPVGIVHQSRKYIKHDWEIAWVNYIIKDSPWSAPFRNIDHEEVDNFGFFCSAENPANLVAGGLITARQFWEFPDIIKKWYGLCSAGVEPTMALYFAACCVVGNEDGITYLKAHGYWPHAALPTCLTKKALSNFLKKTPCFLGKNMSDGGIYYSAGCSVDELWGEADWDNMFRFRKVEPKHYSVASYKEQLVPILNSYYKELTS